jgi:hypothetical protein
MRIPSCAMSTCGTNAGTRTSFFALIRSLRRTEYDHIINCQRFFSTGLMMVLACGKEKIGFDKNPLSLFFTRSVKHEIPSGHSKESGHGIHEVDRLNALIAHLTDASRPLPKLYPDQEARDDAERLLYQFTENQGRYVCIAPASVWFTKQWPEAKWVELIKAPSHGHARLPHRRTERWCTLQRIIRAAGRGDRYSREGDPTEQRRADARRRDELRERQRPAPHRQRHERPGDSRLLQHRAKPSVSVRYARTGALWRPRRNWIAGHAGCMGKACPKGHFRCALGIDVQAVRS